MQVELNSIWQLKDLDGLNDGLYRVLQLYPQDQIVIVFPLVDSKTLQRPIKVGFEQLNEALRVGKAHLSSYELPYYQLQSEANISASHLAKRNEKYSLIADLISSPRFLLDLVEQPRIKLVSLHAKKHNTYVQNLYRVLNLYWKYGQEKNALLPSYKNSGGRGKSRVAGTKKRGSPVQLSCPSFQAPEGVNTTESDKVLFIRAMKQFGLKGEKVRYSRVYDKMLKEYYSDELIAAEAESRNALIPSYRAFIYWIKKLFPAEKLIRKQTNQGDFDRNKRGLRGAATDHTEVPGSCFELDATVLDVHIVSEFQRNHVLGRPTVYCVVDKESRMIVGLHVSMEYASWRAGRQALINSFTSKKEYCAEFGIEIEEDDWPCNHIPQRLLCDRGEFICKDAEDLAVPLIGHLSIAPPYRAELKGIVEHRFNILNEKLVHELLGTTKGRSYIRSDKDPRLDATFTLREITKLLIDEVLEHNSSIFKDLAKQSALIIESNLPPTPLNYWKVHVEAQRHALSRVDEAHARSRLLPISKVTMTSKGIRLNDQMYYDSSHSDFNDWKVIARNNGSWPLEALIDHDNSSFIYVRLEKESGFTRCNLMRESVNFSHRHQADILFFEDWIKLEKSKAKPTAKSIERYQRRNQVIKSAKEELAQAPSLDSKSERTNGMKARRREAILAQRLGEEKPELKQENSFSEFDVYKEHSDHKKQKVVSMLKRKQVERDEN
ncbi:DDE-type integrase/transposase/recombinase [Vibrio breoganii]|uniref:DDE-type integrase/transposase/recombinase n=1 Tax=Vibrio breoganii TaxID=553239 RepID=UPI000C862530|nr:DDE-type integrase/transposase/recombinase [Vibrio breoganii]PMG94090.1 transposase [Vibrio breoganii]